jgi:hypothetical protein
LAASNISFLRDPDEYSDISFSDMQKIQAENDENSRNRMDTNDSQLQNDSMEVNLINESAWLGPQSLYTPGVFAKIQEEAESNESISSRTENGLPKLPKIDNNLEEVDETLPENNSVQISTEHQILFESEVAAIPEGDEEEKEDIKDLLPLSENFEQTENQPAKIKETEAQDNAEVPQQAPVPSTEANNDSAPEPEVKRHRRKSSLTMKAKKKHRNSKIYKQEETSSTQLELKESDGSNAHLLNESSASLNEDPIQFYLKRVKSTQSLESSSMHVSRSLSMSVGTSSNLYSSTIGSSTDSFGALKRRKTLMSGDSNISDIKGSSTKDAPKIIIPTGPDWYALIHNPEKRRLLMTPAELSKYSTLTDTGPPEELALIEGEQGDTVAEIDKLTALISSSHLPIRKFFS